jgi:hypothetical protein
MYQEFPAYNISHFYSPKEKKPTVVFCIPGNNFSSGFVNGWTSTLFYLINNPSFLQPQYMNSNETNSTQELFEVIEPVNIDSKVKLFGGSWKYDFAFIINPRCKFDIQQVLHLFYEVCHNKEFNVLSALVHDNGNTNVYKNNEKITKSNIDENLSHIKYLEAEAIDFDFVIIKNDILELIDFSVFDNENISLELSKQINKVGFSIHVSKDIVIEKERAS